MFLACLDTDSLIIAPLGSSKLSLQRLLGLGTFQFYRNYLNGDKTTHRYSIRWGLFNACAFGAPQSRTRTLIYGTLNGFPTPPLPIPTHTIPAHIQRPSPFPFFKRVTGIYTKPNEDVDWDTERLGPYHHVSIADAIGDLPVFDW
jgi:site-specific DNA-cytosine methylase